MTALQISAIGLVLPLNLKEAVGSPLQRTERPADVLVPNWSLSRSAAFDLKVINPLNSNFLLGASMTSGYTAELGEKDKHSKKRHSLYRERLGLCPIGRGGIWWLGK